MVSGKSNQSADPDVGRNHLRHAGTSTGVRFQLEDAHIPWCTRLRFSSGPGSWYSHDRWRRWRLRRTSTRWPATTSPPVPSKVKPSMGGSEDPPRKQLRLRSDKLCPSSSDGGLVIHTYVLHFVSQYVILQGRWEVGCSPNVKPSGS